MQPFITKRFFVQISGGGDEVADGFINEIDNILKNVARGHYEEFVIVQTKSIGEETALDNAARQWMSQSGIPFVPGQTEYIHQSGWISIKYTIYNNASTVTFFFSDIDVEQTPWSLLDRKLVAFFNCLRIDQQPTTRMKFLSVK